MIISDRTRYSLRPDCFIRHFGRVIRFFVALVVFSTAITAQAQIVSERDRADPEPVIDAAPAEPGDEAIRQRIAKIYGQIDTLAEVEVSVNAGVVNLSGSVANERYAERALDLAIRLEGVVTVEDRIDRTLEVSANVRPIIDQFRADINRWAKAVPLVLLALLTFVLIAFAGMRLAKWSSLWSRVSPNPFLAALIAQAVRIAAVLLGLVLALNLMGATALLGTVLGGAGVLGLAVGFAVRDTLENYISSIMLSLRQPFRANEHVLINDHEGKVVRLTSRATVLMTLDGNQLRIPNSVVFKAVILNYSRNPERRFEFELGVDADDDPVAAMKTGLDAIGLLPFLLREPAPNAIITAVGDSNIIVKFLAWIDQRETDFGKARSLTIRAAKIALEQNGFTLPEPIYRLRFDSPISDVVEKQKQGVAGGAPPVVRRTQPDDARKDEPVVNVADMDVEPDMHIEKMVDEERLQEGDTDLLDGERPVE